MACRVTSALRLATAERSVMVGQAAVKQRVERGHVFGQDGVVHLGVLRQQGHDHRYADAAAQIAGQAEQAGGVGAEAGFQRGEGQRAERHEDEAEAQALDHAGYDDRTLAHLDRETRSSATATTWSASGRRRSGCGRRSCASGGRPGSSRSWCRHRAARARGRSSPSDNPAGSGASAAAAPWSPAG